MDDTDIADAEVIELSIGELLPILFDAQRHDEAEARAKRDMTTHLCISMYFGRWYGNND